MPEQAQPVALPPGRRTSRLALLSLVFSIAMPLVFIVLLVVLVVMTAGTIIVFFIPYAFALIFFCAVVVGMATVARARIKGRPELKGELYALGARQIAFTMALCISISVALFCGLPWCLLAYESHKWREQGDKMIKTADALVQTTENLRQDMTKGGSDTNMVLLVEESRAWRQSIDNLRQFDFYTWAKDSLKHSFQSVGKDLHLESKSRGNGTNSPAGPASSAR